jgi:hypothetical protein
MLRWFIARSAYFDIIDPPRTEPSPMPSIQGILASLTYNDILYDKMGVRRPEAELRSKFGVRMTQIAHIYEQIDSAGDPPA